MRSGAARNDPRAAQVSPDTRRVVLGRDPRLLMIGAGIIRAFGHYPTWLTARANEFAVGQSFLLVRSNTRHAMPNMECTITAIEHTPTRFAMRCAVRGRHFERGTETFAVRMHQGGTVVYEVTSRAIDEQPMRTGGAVLRAGHRRFMADSCAVMTTKCRAFLESASSTTSLNDEL